MMLIIVLYGFLGPSLFGMAIEARAPAWAMMQISSLIEIKVNNIGIIIFMSFTYELLVVFFFYLHYH